MPKFKILALSGGGFLGLYTAHVLNLLETHLKTPVATRADILAGTSVGGLIALALANGTASSDICDSLCEHGPEIFPKRWPHRRVASLWKPSAHQPGLEEVIEKHIPRELRIGELQETVLITSVDLTTGKIREFFGGEGADNADANIKVAEVALATSAAPTFFPIVRVADRHYTDGGIAANAPDLFAIHKAQYSLGIQHHDISMLSIGTTNTPVGLQGIKERRRDWGMAQWFWKKRVLNYLMQTQMNLSRSLAKDILKEDYIYVDAQPTEEQAKIIGLAIANEQAQTTLKGLAENSANELENNPFFQAWVA
jgi:patatin-like phospholipase/acyl hydrolase